MRNYNRLFKEVARRLNEFVKNVAGNTGKVLQNFLKDLWVGMLAARDVVLMEIARGTECVASLKKQVDRFCDRLNSFFCMALIWNYHRIIKPEINDRTIFCIDNTDVTKPYGFKFEHLCMVRDGSNGNIEKGYEITNIVALTTDHRQPIPLYSYLFSNSEPDYVSNNDETEKALKCINSSFGNIGIKVFDRGYDDSKLMRFLINNNEKFIIRCKENRILIHDDKEYRMEDLVKKLARETTFYFKDILLTFKSHAIWLQGMEFNLVVVTGFGAKPMTLLTNLPASNDLAQTVGKVYMLRWKIEEKHRFEKMVFNLEDFRVRGIKAIRNLNMLTSMLCGFIAIICEHQKRKLFKDLFKMSKTLPKPCKKNPDLEHGFGKNHLFFYSITRALSELYNAWRTRKYFSSS